MCGYLQSKAISEIKPYSIGFCLEDFKNKIISVLLSMLGGLT